MKNILSLVLILAGFSGYLEAKELDSSREVTVIVREKAAISQMETDFKKPLHLQQILSLAIVQNPELKAKLAEAQVSAADKKQLGLIESPHIGFGARFPVSSPGSKTAYDVSLTQNLIDLFQLPNKKKMGQSGHESRKWEIASDVLKILTDVKVAYYQYQASLQLKSFWQSNLIAARAAADLAAEQRKAGNIGALDEVQNISINKIAELEFSRSVNEAKQAQILLAKLAGLPPDSSWKIPGQLPRLPRHDPSLNELKERITARRADVIAQRHRIEAGERNLKIAKSAFLPRLDLGVAAEWDAEGSRGVGPVVEFGLPLLGHRRAGIQKAKAELNMSRQTLSALEQGIPYDLDQTYQQLVLARQSASFYQNDVLPIQKRILEESLKHYNYMLLGNYQLLQSKQNQMNAQRDSILALRDYWIAHAHLENIAGGTLQGLENTNLK